MRDNQGGESDPAEGVHRRCKKNFPSFLSCIGKRTKDGCDRGSEVETNNVSFILISLWKHCSVVLHLRTAQR